MKEAVAGSSQRLVCRVLGVDADTTQFGARGIRCVACDLERELPPLLGGTVRLITAIEVIEHLANTEQFVPARPLYLLGMASAS